LAGYQEPYKGDGYAGFTGVYIYVTPSKDTFYNLTREYLQCQLTNNIEKGARYSVSLRISMAEESFYSVNNVGVLFSENSITDYSSTSYLPLYRRPQVEFSQSVTDTANWVLLADTIDAGRDLHYMTIGVFADSTKLVISRTGFGNVSSLTTYFYVDDVQVVKIRDALKIKDNTSVCVNYTDSLDLIATSGFPDYHWYDSTTNILLQTGDSLLEVKPTVTTTYMVIADDDTAYATITVNPLPEFVLGTDSNLCDYEDLELSSRLSNALISEYQWSTNETASGITVDRTETEVWHQVTDTNGCIWRDTINLTWQTPPTVELSNDTLICEGETAELEAYVSLSPPWRKVWTDDYNLVWQSAPTLTITSDSTASVSPLADTYFYATVDDGKCTGNTDSVLVEVKQNPITSITPKNQTICQGVQTEITAAGGQTYLWDIGGSLGTETTDNKRTISSSVSTYIAVQAIDAPCRGVWDTAFITIDNLPLTADFTVTPDSGSTVFKPTVQNLSNGGELYYWNFDNGEQYTVTSAEDAGVFGTYYPEYPLAGSYDIRLRATRQSGCADSTGKRIIVTKKFILEIPNAFSPNGDNLNDIWNVTTSAGTTVSAAIYNRWGELIFQWDTSSPEVSGWNGMYQGAPAQDGVYVYVLTVKELDKTVHYEKGTISLVR
jgi:gliding motility-associated-like protein